MHKHLLAIILLLLTFSTTPVLAQGAYTPTGLVQTCPNPGDIPGVSPGCRDINILILQLIKLGEYVFQIIGTLAFLMFVISGFRMITSMGNAETFKSAGAGMFAAVIGLLISISAFVLIDFVLDSLGVSSGFRFL